MAKHDRLSELKIDRADPEEARRGGGPGLVVAAILVTAIGAGIWWWMRGVEVPEVRVATVEAAGAVEPPGASSVLDASGYVTARRRATVSSKITGKIVEVAIEEGMEVEEGQMLARLDASTPTRQLALGEAELEASRRALAENEVLLVDAKRDLGRAKRLVEANVSSQSEVDDLEAQVDALEARLDLGREQIEVAARRVALRRQELDDHVIRAPFAGVVVTKNAQPGEMISPVSAGGGFTRTGIGTLVDMESLEIEVDVNEAYINRVKPGQEVEAVLDAYPQWRIPARVITPVPTADRQKATVKVRIALEERDGRILPDMGVRVAFLDPEAPSIEEVEAPAPRPSIPAQALRSDGEIDVVFVVAGGQVERRAVRVERQADLAWVEAGLRAGEQVVIEGPEDLADGDAVRVEAPES